MRTTLTYGILGWLLVAWSASTLAQESIPWARNLKAAQEAAAKDGKLVLLHFWAPDCPPCQTVDRYVFPHPDVARAIATNYVPLSVNAQALPEIAKRFGVDRWPTEVIISAEGEVLSRTVSPKDAKEYVGLINRVAAAKRAPQNKWGELAQNQRQQPPAYQANQFQSAAPKPSPYVGSIANAEGQKPGGEFEPAASPYQPGRPTEATSGFGQYGMTAGGQEPNGASRNPYVSGKGATSFSGNPYVDVAAARPVSAPQENPHVTSGGGFGEASPRRDFAPQGGEFAAQPWNENGRPAPSRSVAPAGEPQPGFSPVNHEAAHRRVASESIIENPAMKPEAPLALEGYCPVTLVEAQDWKRGTPEFGAIHRGRTYLFTGKREQVAFLADPDRFSPVLSGYDPVKFFESGEFVPGKRQFGVYLGDQIFLFADNDARQRFEASPQVYAKQVHEAMLRNVVGNRMR